MTWIFSAFLLGFLGSFHCAGMCGPIALSLPLRPGSNMSFIAGRMLYNGGRIVTYSILGLLAGFIGHTIAMAGFQKSFSILAGVFIILAVALPYLFSLSVNLGRLTARYTSGIKVLFKKIFGLKSRITLFLIGTVNGLLPCGFVYLALAGASTAGSYLYGLGYMLLFGLGTVPVMLSLSVAGKLFGFKTQAMIRKISPLVGISLAILLIWRGIYISPHSCCQQH